MLASRGRSVLSSCIRCFSGTSGDYLKLNDFGGEAPMASKKDPGSRDARRSAERAARDDGKPKPRWDTRRPSRQKNARAPSRQREEETFRDEEPQTTRASTTRGPVQRDDPSLRFILALRSAGNDSRRVDQIFADMRKYRQKIDARIFSVALASGSRGAVPPTSAQIDRLLKIASDYKVVPDVGMNNAAIAAFGRAGDMERACEIFKAMMINKTADTITFSTMISLFCDRHPPEIETASRTVKEMLARGLKPNVRTFTSLISACANAVPTATPDAAEKYFEEMVEKYEIVPTLPTFNALLWAHAKSATPDIKRLEEIFTQLVSSEVPPTEGTISAMMTGYARCTPPQLEKVVSLFSDMGKKYKIEPSRSSFVAVLTALGRDDPTPENFTNALEVLSNMQEFGINPKAAQCNMVLLMVNKARPINLSTVERLGKFMREAGIAPNAATVSILSHTDRINPSVVTEEFLRWARSASATSPTSA